MAIERLRLKDRLAMLSVPIDEGEKLNSQGERAGASIDGWQYVRIDECGEPLVDLSRNEDLNLFVDLSPQYFQRKVPESIETVFVRKGVASALYRATFLLPLGCRFKIWGGWQPIVTQRALFDEYYDELKSQKPKLEEAVIRQWVQRFFLLPSGKSEITFPYSTGGAIDLTLVGPNGKELNMGTGFNHFCSEAHTIHFEDLLRDGDLVFSKEESEILKNRRRLFSIMRTAGFTNDPWRWWRYDYGNQIWAVISEREAAIYGATAPIQIVQNDEPCRTLQMIDQQGEPLSG